MRLLGEVLADEIGDEFGAFVFPGNSLFDVLLKYGLMDVLSIAKSDARKLATLKAELDFVPLVFGAPLNVTLFRIFFIVVFNDVLSSAALETVGFTVAVIFELVFVILNVFQKTFFYLVLQNTYLCF